MQKEPNLKWLLTVLVGTILGFAGWIANQTYQNALETKQVHAILTALSQQVTDGKEARLESQRINENNHRIIETRVTQLEIKVYNIKP